MCKEYEPDALVAAGQDIFVRDYLESQSIAKLRSFVGNHLTFVIDEAQHVRDIGLNLKLIVDHIPDISVVATELSSFGLGHAAGTPLTGCKHTLVLSLLEQSEIQVRKSRHETASNLEARRIYGAYPEVVLKESNQERELYLQELIDSYLLKDILQAGAVRLTDKLLRLLQPIAFQIGKQVSLTELG